MAQTIDQKIAELLWWGNGSYQDRVKNEQKKLDDWKAGKGIGGFFYNVPENVSDAFDIIAWINQNWKLAIVGFISLLLLLRD